MKPIILLLLAGVGYLPVYGVQIGNLQFTQTPHQIYEKAELTFTLSQSYSNVYDPDEVRVDALITAPGGNSYEMPCFYYVPATFESAGFANYTLNSGAGTWMLRFAPRETGTYSVRIRLADAGGIFLSATKTTEVTWSDAKGFVYVDPANPQYMRHANGDPYHPIGFNLSWNSNHTLEASYDYYLGRMGAENINWMRYWLTPFARQALEWRTGHWSGWYGGLGQYSQRASAMLDAVVAQCEANDVYMQLVINHHGQYSETVNAMWADNPYHIGNGGYLQQSGEFFASAQAKAQQKKMYRYIVARWGYSSHILTWELFNEAQFTGGTNQNIADWHDEMSLYIRSIDPYDHVITTSASKAQLILMNDHEAMDQLQDHVYADPIHEQLIQFSDDLTDVLKKPVWVGEYGSRGEFQDDFYGLGHPDLWGDHVRRSTWIGLMQQVPNMFWYWDLYIEAYDLFHIYRPAADYFAGFDPVREGGQARYVPQLLNVPELEETQATVNPGRGWTNNPPMAQSFTLLADASLQPPASQMNQYIHGSWNTNLGTYVEITANFLKDGAFTVQVSDVSTFGTHSSRILIDGNQVAAPNFSGSGSRTVTVPAGTHTIRFENTGQDWIRVGSFTLVNAAGGAVIGVMGMRTNEGAYGFLYDNRFEWDANGYPVENMELVFEQLTDGTYKVAFMNTHNGQWIQRPDVSVSGGQAVTVQVPVFNKDLAYKLTLDTEAFQGEVTYDFNDGTFQGWTDLTAPNTNSGPRNWALSPPAFPGVAHSGSGAIGQNIEGEGIQDSSHPTLWLRSPEFVLDGSGALSVWLRGGTGSGNLTGVPVGSVPANSSSPGFQGVALRNANTETFVLSGSKTSSGDNWEQIVFTASQLAALDQNATYTLDLIDAGHGGWGWVAMDSVTIPGGESGEEPTPTPTLTPFVQINGGEWLQQTNATLCAGGTVLFGPHPMDENWQWTGPNGFSANTRAVTLSNITTAQAGNYVATYTANGSSDSVTYSVNVHALPQASVGITNASEDQNNGTISLTFPDTAGRTNISFSINDGQTYTSVADNSGSYTFSNLPPGDYAVWSRWGNGDCPVKLGDYQLIRDASDFEGEVTYDFDDGTFQGWTDLTPANSNSGPRNWSPSPPAFPGVAHSGAGAIGQNIEGGGIQDSSHPTLWLRSPAFVLDGSGDLSVWLFGGTGEGSLTGVPVGSVPAQSSDPGFQGVALRNVNTETFVLSGSKTSSGDNWEQIVFTASQLAALDQNAVYTLDLIDAGHGGWGWVAMDSVTIPGEISSEEPPPPPPPSPPTISSISGQTILVNTSTGTLSLTVGSEEVAPGALTLTGSSSNTALVPNGNIVFGGSGAERTVTVMPAADQTGSATITVIVSDGERTADTAFVVTVELPPEEPPPADLDRTWVGASHGGNGNWGVAGNWNPSGVPGASDTAIFGGTANAIVNLGNQTPSIEGMIINKTGTTFFHTVEQNVRQLDFGSGGLTIHAGAGAVTFSGGSTDRVNPRLNADQVWRNDSANPLTVASLINATNTPALTVMGSGDISVSLRVGLGTSPLNSLTKSGTGTLTLDGNIFATNGSTVQSGTLLLNAIHASQVTVASGGTLGGTGTLGATSVNGNLRPGSHGIGLLSFSSSLGLQGSAVTTMEIVGVSARGTSYDAIDVTFENGLTFGGALQINFTGTAEVGSYNLFDFAGNSGGGFGSVTLGGSYSGTLSQSGAGVWTGDAGGLSFTFAEASGDLTIEVQSEPGPQLMYAFADGTLEGWTEAGSDGQGLQFFAVVPPSLNSPNITPHSGDYFIGLHIPAFDLDAGYTQDSEHGTLILRSPEFTLNGSGDLTLWLAGGGSAGISLAGTSVASLPTASSTEGFLGVALRNVTTGTFMLSASKSTGGNEWEQVSFTAAQLAALPPGDIYTLDLIDARHGGWGWVNMDTVRMPSTLAENSIQPTVPKLSIQGWGENQMRLSWPSAAVGWTLQRSADYDGAYSDAGLEVTVEGDENAAYDSIVSPKQFYRLIE